jgi:S1-C subfamily serine protease
MFSRIIATFLIFVSLPLIAMAADDTTMISSVMKIKTYERNSIDGNYVFSHYGSAVLIDSKRIITNAHVVLDADNKLPT